MFGTVLLPLLLFVGTQAITYDEIKQIRCYTPRQNLSRRELFCSAVISDTYQCTNDPYSPGFIGKTRDVTVTWNSSPPKILNVTEDQRLCDLEFTGRCATRAFGRKSDNLCLQLSRRDRTYGEAVRDCEQSGGSLYVPDSDYELNELIRLVEKDIDHFWLGGGSVFYRTCRDASKGEKEEVAIIYGIANRDAPFIGFATTRETVVKAPYICATSKRRGNRNKVCLGEAPPCRRDVETTTWGLQTTTWGLETSPWGLEASTEGSETST